MCGQQSIKWTKNYSVLTCSWTSGFSQTPMEDHNTGYLALNQAWGQQSKKGKKPNISWNGSWLFYTRWCAKINHTICKMKCKISFLRKSSEPWQVRKSTIATKLLEEQAILFHHNVVKLLFLSNQTQQGIQTPVTFLTTWVKEPDDDD